MKLSTTWSKSVWLLVASALVSTTYAREIQGITKKMSITQKVLAGCNTPQSSAELTINNVRTIIFSGSDMWWDLFGSSNAWYAIPKVADRANFVNSNFAGNVWFGGLDAGNQLKIAAQTYRQDGIDFWTGPLSTVDASVTQEVCNKYDKIYRMTRKEVDDFIANGTITQAIKDWPGNGDLSLNQDQNLAPYVDKDNSGTYNPEGGEDYPAYDVNNNLGKDNLERCKARLFGDETLWWVYNDNGDVHQATGGKAIGMEIRAQAFAFKTTDDINNMTFYSYELINRSSFTLFQTYMTVWTDADLGCYLDDYIGCDVKRGLGYIYNGDNDDQNCGSNGYGSFVPALGCDFFQGPLADPGNGKDDDQDGTIDELGEQMGMTKFLYYNNNIGTFIQQMTNPDNAQQYYQYMTGFWRDGTPFTCDAANGYGGAVKTDFVFPGNTYPNSPCGPAVWEETAVPADRRFLQSSGPFTLKPGAVNYVTVGLPWARTASAGSPKASVELLKLADDKAQSLFDNCFKVLDGPEAPDMTIQELDNELIIYLSANPGSNNYLNLYKELDSSIPLSDSVYYGSIPVVISTPTGTKTVNEIDRYYRLEGFKIYQLKGDFVTQEQLTDPSKAKLAFSCDIKNGVKRLVNYEYDPTSGGDLPKVKVDGVDNGLQSTFHFTRDLFSSTSDQKVVNNKAYYFYCVAYGYNQYGEYKEDVPWSGKNQASLKGQKRPYLEGRKSKKAYGIPHAPQTEKEGTISNSYYGYGPKITRIEGQGNGGNNLELTEASIDNIFNNQDRVNTLTYENGKGPIHIKVVDPLNVPNSTFAVKFVKKVSYGQNKDSLPCKVDYNSRIPLKNTEFGEVLADSVTWVLKDLTTQKEYLPCKSIQTGEEFYFSEIGLSVNIGQVQDIGNISVPSSSNDKVVQEGDFIAGTISFADASVNWLSGIQDNDQYLPANWIRSGSFKASSGNADPNDYEAAINGGNSLIDPNAVFEKIINGTWAPFCLTASSKPGSTAAPAPSFMTNALADAKSTRLLLNQPYDIRALASVDIVFTKDKSKWTRAIVLEESDDVSGAINGARKLEARRSRSVDKQGIPLGAPGCNTAEAYVDSIPGTPFYYGLSWFPGYAINLETGERLNMAFGEDSYQSSNNSYAPNNGEDMMWNPTSTTIGSDGYAQFGGRHYVYVFGHNRSTMKYANTSGGIASLSGKTLGVGTYKQFSDFAYSYKLGYAVNNVTVLNTIWSEAMWVNMPLTSAARYHFKNPADMPCDAKVRLRVRKPYRYGSAGLYYNSGSGFLNTSLVAPIIPYSYAAASYVSQLTQDTISGSVNNNFGYYTFNTADIFTETNNAEQAKSALDLINVVPNPYYGYSTYEQRRADNLIRMTNLPNKCKIKIFTLNGTLVRTFDRDVSGQEDVNITASDFVRSKRLSYQEWDLKNQNNIPVASGLYIIHIDVPGVGEKILKWFGVMKPLDLQNY